MARPMVWCRSSLAKLLFTLLSHSYWKRGRKITDRPCSFWDTWNSNIALESTWRECKFLHSDWFNQTKRNQRSGIKSTWLGMRLGYMRWYEMIWDYMINVNEIIVLVIIVNVRANKGSFISDGLRIVCSRTVPTVYIPVFFSAPLPLQTSFHPFSLKYFSSLDGLRLPHYMKLVNHTLG